MFEAFNEIMRGDIQNLNLALDLILGEMANSVKTKVLKWDAKHVKYMTNNGDSKVAQGLLADGGKFMDMETDLGSSQRNTNLVSIRNQVFGIFH